MNDVRYFISPRLPDDVLDRRAGHQDLDGGDPTAAHSREQALGHHAQEDASELRANLVLLVRGKNVHNPVNTLRRFVGVKSGKNQVTGLRDSDRRPYRIEIAETGHLVFA